MHTASLTSIYSVPAGLLVLAAFPLLAWASLSFLGTARNEIEADLGNPSFLPQLEGLRGFMAASVVVFHGVIVFLAYPRTGVWAEVPSNFYAQLGVAPVLMFFFLTGFLFWSKLLRSPRVALAPYLRARWRRLAPVYGFAMLWLFLLVAVETHFERNTGISTLLRSAGSWLLFTEPGMPDVNGLNDTRLLIAGTPWTLAMEWRFYLLLPLLAWFARKQHRFLYLLAAAFGVYLLCSEQLLRRLHLTQGAGLLEAIHATAGHLVWSFGVGMAVAVLHRRVASQRRFFASSAVSIACLVLAAAVMFRLTPRFLSTPESCLLGLIFFCVASGNTLWKTLSSAPLLLLGRCSYSLYLCHGLVLSSVLFLLRSHAHGPVFSAPHAWELIAVCSVAAFAVSLAVHLWVEAPFLVTRKTGLPPLPAESR